MRRYKPYAVILLIMAAQIIFSFQNESRYFKRVGEEIAAMEQGMEEDGVRDNQARHVSAALRSVRLYTSSYVQGQSTQIVIFNALALFILLGLRSKDEAPL